MDRVSNELFMSHTAADTEEPTKNTLAMTAERLVAMMEQDKAGEKEGEDVEKEGGEDEKTAETEGGGEREKDPVGEEQEAAAKDTIADKETEANTSAEMEDDTSADNEAAAAIAAATAAAQEEEAEAAAAQGATWAVCVAVDHVVRARAQCVRVRVRACRICRVFRIIPAMLRVGKLKKLSYFSH